MTIVAFPRPRRKSDGLGLFFTMPQAEQHARIRDLARKARLSSAQIASITHLSAAEVLRILEAGE